MNAEDLVHRGQLKQALEALQTQVRQHPADAKLRVFLFQLLALTGAWQRALGQLDSAAELDAKTLPMVGMYQDAVRCEAHRETVFTGHHQPLLFGEPEPWMALLFEALRLIGQGNLSAAAELRDQAFEQAPATPGEINGEAFDWIADADGRIGPMLELILNGRYYWVPFARIPGSILNPPRSICATWCGPRYA